MALNATTYYVVVILHRLIMMGTGLVFSQLRNAISALTT